MHVFSIYLSCRHRRLELFAGALDMVAAFGWMYQWYVEFVTDLASSPEYVTIGRGFTLDDPGS